MQNHPRSGGRNGCACLAVGGQDVVVVGGKGLTSCEKLDTADNRREVAGAEVSTAPPSATWGHSLLVGRAAANTCCSICCRTVMGTETPRHTTHMMSTTGSVLLLEVDEASQSGSECRALARGDVRLICRAWRRHMPGRWPSEWWRTSRPRWTQSRPAKTRRMRCQR